MFSLDFGNCVLIVAGLGILDLGERKVAVFVVGYGFGISVFVGECEGEFTTVKRSLNLVVGIVDIGIEENLCTIKGD